MKRTALPLTLSVAAIAIAASHPAHAAIVVGSCTPGQQYSTIQAAVNAAPSGAIISVCPGGYFEQVLIEKPLTLQGITANGDEGAIIMPPQGGLVAHDIAAAQVEVKNTSAVTLTNLIVDGQTSFNSNTVNAGIEFYNASGTVNKMVLRNQATVPADVLTYTGVGLLAYGDAGSGATVTVENSEFRNQSGYGVMADGSGLTLNTLDNYIAGPNNSSNAQNYNFGIGYTNLSTGSIKGNVVVHEVFASDPYSTVTSASAGIEINCSSATVSDNMVMDSQVGIALANCASTLPHPSTVSGNLIFDTRTWDAIYVAYSGDKVTGNTIVGAGESGIHIDATQPLSGVLVTGNSITETCAGVLTTGTPATTTVSSNTFYGVYIPTLSGNACGPIF